MAESADGRTAGTWVSDVVVKRKEGEEENVYNQDADMLMFPFGKGVTTKLGKSLVPFLISFIYPEYVHGLANKY